MKTKIIATLLSLAACGAWAQSPVATNATASAGAVLQRSGGQTDALVAGRQAMQQAEAAYNVALSNAAPQLIELDAQIAQARSALMTLQMQRQSLVRTAEGSIADVVNAREAARTAYLQAARAQMAARQAAIATQRVTTVQQ